MRRVIFLLLLLSLSAPLFAQTNATDTQPAPAAPPKEDLELRKEAVALIGETAADVNNLRTLENRIAFSAELAGLMWYHDEKEARSMYAGVFNNFRELVGRYDMQMNSLGVAAATGTTRDAFTAFFAEPTGETRIRNGFAVALAVRQQIANGIAELDPALAFQFFEDSVMGVSNPALLKTLEESDKNFRGQLLTAIAATDPAAAVDQAIKGLAKDGLRFNHLELLDKVYKKDAEKGAKLASAMLEKARQPSKDDLSSWIVSEFLEKADESLTASEKKDGKQPPMLSRSDVQALAETLAGKYLDQKPDEDDIGEFQGLDRITKYSPGKAAQIRAKFKLGSGTGPGPGKGYPVNTSPNLSMTTANAANGSVPPAMDDDSKRTKEIADTSGKLADTKLSKEEREKIVARSRQLIMAFSGKETKIVGLSALAGQVAKAGDKELATEIMRDAVGMASPTPKNFRDYILTWMLISGYSNVDAPKALTLLEETIARANTTLDAFVKVGEFIDANEQMIVDGEVQLGAFGGGMIRGLTGQLAVADSTIKTLARSDLKRTYGLTNRFDRPELRVLAKVMVLRAVLGKQKATVPTGGSGFDSGTIVIDVE